MKFLKKGLSLLLVLCMLVSFVPMGLFTAKAKAADTGDFYKIVQVDAGRKYWSLEVLEQLVDHMAANGYNQLGLYFSDNQGFRLALKDMTVEANGTTYDLSKALGNGIYQLGLQKGAPVCDDADPAAHFRPSLDGGINYLEQEDMDALIAYAKVRGIEIVPTFDMPGHMGAILKQFPQFKITYNGSVSASTLDVTSKDAVNFALAILKQYVAYFSEQGCKYFNICSDEFCYDLSNHAKDTDETTTNKIVEFMDQAAQIIVNAGMTPRAYSDYMYMHSGNYAYSDAYNQFQVIFWDSASSRTLEQVKAHKLTIINGDEKAYYALGSGYYKPETTQKGVEDFTPLHVTTMESGFDLPYANGAQFHIWCDKGYYESEAAKGGDAGATVLENTKGYMETLSQSLVSTGYDRTITQPLAIGGGFTIGTFEGDRTKEDWAQNLGLSDTPCVKVTAALSRSAADSSIDLSAQLTELTDGASIIIGNGSLYLTLDAEAKTLGVTNDASQAAVWTCKKGASKMLLQSGGLYLASDLAYNNAADALVATESAAKGWALSGTSLRDPNYSYKYIVLTQDGATDTAADSGVGAYAVTPGQTAQTTVTITGMSDGKAQFSYEHTNYVFNVGDFTPEACNHEKLTYHAEVEATESNTGRKEYWQCSRCRAYFADIEAQQEVSYKDLEIPKLHHTTHSLEKVDMVAATVEKEGIREHYECSVCHALFKDQDGTQSTTEAELVIPKLSQEDQKYAVTVEVGSQAAGTAVTTKNQDTGITAGSTYSVTNAEGTEIATYTVQVDTKEEQAGGDVTVGDLIGTDTISVGGSAVCVLGDGTNYIKADCTLGNADAAAKWRITRETEAQYSIQLEGESSYLTSTGFWGRVALNAAKALWRYDGSKDGSKLTDPSGYYLTVYENLPKTGNAGTPMRPYAAADSSAATYTVYTYTPTFTGKTAGTGEVIIGGQTYTVTVTAPHVHDLDETKTCQGQRCKECGLYVKGDDNAYVDDTNHVGGTEVRGYVAATDTTPGYTGDTYCKGCGVKLADGTTILAGRTIELNEHEVYEFDVPSESRLELVHTAPGPQISSISATFMPYDSGDPTTKVTDMAEVTDGQKLYVTDGNRYLVLNADNTLSVTTKEEEATQWTVYVNGSGHFKLVCRDMALAGTHDSTAGGDVTVQPANLSDWNFNDWVLVNGSLRREYAMDEFLNLSGDVPAFTTTDCTVGVYKPSTAQPARTHVTLTAGVEGKSSFTLGEVNYNVIVRKEDVSDKRITLDKFVTNMHVSEKKPCTDYTVIVEASRVNTESGVPLSELVPKDGVSNGHPALFWHGTLQPSGLHQGCVNEGNYDGDRTKTPGVLEFNYLRYYAGAWSVSKDGTSWQKVEDTDQLVARYILVTAVTKEIETWTQDWGEYTKSVWIGADQQPKDSWVQLDFAVKYEAGAVNPDPNEYPISGKTMYYHASHAPNRNDKVDVLTEDGTTLYRRRLDTIIGNETTEREVYMITVTPSSDSHTQELNTNEKPNYTGTETVVWLRDADTAYPIDMPFDEELFSWGIAPTEEQIAKMPSTHPGLMEAYGGTYRVTEDTDEIPYVDHVYAYNHHGVLVTYYIRAKKDAAKLRVHYREWQGADDKFFEFYNYGMVTLETKFDDGFEMDASQEDLLVHNVVHSDVGVALTVTGVLTKMPAVPAQYRTGEYSLLKVIREDQDVYLYYTSSDLERYIVADFGLPMEITWENVFRSLDISQTYQFVGMKYMDHQFTDGKGNTYPFSALKFGTISTNGPADDDGLVHSLTYTPDQVFTDNESVFYVAVTMRIPVETQGKATEWETVTKYCAVHILPATTVYYEPTSNFVSAKGWRTGTVSGLGQGTYAIRKDPYVYGYDPAYAGTTGASANTEMTPDDKSTAASFEFTGTGVELYANCTDNTSRLMAVLSRKENGAYVIQRGFMVDTKIGAGKTDGTEFQNWKNAYNVPVVAVKGLEFGTYKLDIYQMDKLGESREDIRIDGIRVSDPAQSQRNRLAYSQNKEMDPTFLEVRDLVFGTVSLPTGWDEKSQYKEDLLRDLNSQVLGLGSEKITGILVQESPISEKVALDVLDNGPKNELYLQPGRTLILSVSKDFNYQIGMKSIDGKLSYVTNKETNSAITLGTTDQYYTVEKRTEGESTLLYITNSDSGTLILTKLKCLPVDQSPATATSGATQAEIMESLTAETMAEAIAALSSDDAPVEEPKPDDGKTEPTEPEPTEPEPAKPYKDVADFKDVKTTAWYYEPVKFVAARGLMVGVAEDRFGPDTALTRAMMVQLLYAYEGSQPNDGRTKFRDVAPDAWYAKAVCWAAANGIVSGTSDTTFDPNTPITREQMVAILQRYARFKGLEVESSGDLSRFPDHGQVSDWATESMNWAVDVKIIAGSGGKILPKGVATRAQVATVLKAFVELMDRI